MSRYTVFLPVRNGWPYVQQCVESVLGQQSADVEMRVLDNQSSDATLDWLHSVRDPRLIITRSNRALTISESWARVKASPKAEFMTLIGHDDLLDPGFLNAIESLIQAHPEAGLYQTGARYINSAGATIRPCAKVPVRETASEYLGARLSFSRDVFGTGYVMRSADYEAAGGIPSFEKLFFADDALWLRLMSRSFKAADPRELCSVRIHPASESASTPAVWQPLLKGIGQFAGSLTELSRESVEVARVCDSLGPAFMLKYHRNILIYALVEASQAGRRLDADALSRIEKSLLDVSGLGSSSLRKSLPVATLSALNATPLRSLIPAMWRAYYSGRTRG